MKTCLLNTTLVAGLATTLLAGSARAEDAGVVRLGNTATDASAAGEGNVRIVARGQSGTYGQGSPGLLQLLSGGLQSHSDAYDSCCSSDCDDCCPSDCDNCCPTDGDTCCPTDCGDGCDGCGDGCNGCGSGSGGCGGNGCGLGGCSFGGGFGNCGCGCGNCTCGCGYGRYGCDFLARQCAMFQARKRANNARLNNYLHCKLGYFIHDGCGGVGCKPFGCYSIVYPDNPAHFDGRDGQIYAAQGVGGPVSVPTAPNVRHAYNYGWGVPSSRLTPISNAPY